MRRGLLTGIGVSVGATVAALVFCLLRFSDFGRLPTAEDAAAQQHTLSVCRQEIRRAMDWPFSWPAVYRQPDPLLEVIHTASRRHVWNSFLIIGEPWPGRGSRTFFRCVTEDAGDVADRKSYRLVALDFY